jgi:hypothetical protein
VELQTMTALVFIVTSSLVLLFLFFFKSIWSAWLLVFLFCVGAVQVLYAPNPNDLALVQLQMACIASPSSLVYRKFPRE